MNKPKKLVILLCAVLALLIAALIFLWVRFGQRPQSYECTNYAMGTYVQQTVYGGKREAAATAAAKSIGQLEDLISWQLADSDIAKLNESAGSVWTTLDAKTVALLQKSLDVAEKSGGAFDPTMLPVTSLWDFGGENQHVPDSAEIQKYLPYINYKDLRIDAEKSSASLKLHYMAVDLGAVGKGAACDEAVAAYKSAGAQSAIVAVGSSVGVYGAKSDGSPWNIAVRDPKSGKNDSTAMGTVDLTAGFASTADVYEKSFTQNGVLYHHLLNPKTGYPENNGLISVTVSCGSGALSDALSAACFVLGREKGAALLKQYGAEGIFITGDKQVYVTDGMKGRFKITNKQYILAD